MSPAGTVVSALQRRKLGPERQSGVPTSQLVSSGQQDPEPCPSHGASPPEAQASGPILHTEYKGTDLLQLKLLVCVLLVKQSPRCVSCERPLGWAESACFSRSSPGTRLRVPGPGDAAHLSQHQCREQHSQAHGAAPSPVQASAPRPQTRAWPQPARNATLAIALTGVPTNSSKSCPPPGVYLWLLC